MSIISYLRDVLSHKSIREEIATLRSEHEAAVATHAVAVAQLKQEHAASIAALKQEHASAIADVKSSFEKEIASVREQSRKDAAHLGAEIEHLTISKRDAPGARSVRPVKN